MKHLRITDHARNLRNAVQGLGRRKNGRPTAAELGIDPANTRGICGMPLRRALCPKPGGHKGDCEA